MILDLTQTQFETIQSNLQTAGLSFDFESINYSDFILRADNKEIHTNVSLPDPTKTCGNYMAAILWLKHSNNRYSGFPLCHKFSESYGLPTPSSSMLVFSMLDASPGTANISIYEEQPSSTDDPDFSFLQDVYKIMYIYSDTSDFTIANTLITESIEETFTYANYLYVYSSYNILDTLNNPFRKSNLLTLCYEYDQSKIAKCFRLTQSSPAIPQSQVVVNADVNYKKSYRYYYQTYSNIKISFFNFTANILDIEMLDISALSEEEFGSLSNSQKQHLAQKNNDRMQFALYTCGSDNNNRMDICFPSDKTFYVTGPLRFSNYINILGNNSTIKIYNDSTGVELFVKSNSAVSNISIYDLNIVGRTDEFVDGSYTYDDQAFHFTNRQLMVSNFLLYNVKISNFKYGVHVNYVGSNYNPNPNEMNWVFDKCSIIKCRTNFMLGGVNKLDVISSHIDNSLSVDSYEHAFYISEFNSNITIENCLIENSMGVAIRLDGVNGLKYPYYSQYNTFRNITIKNCYRGFWIGKVSKDILIENVNAIGVVRALQLENCIDVTVSNYNASGTTVNKLIRTIGSNIILKNKSESASIQTDPFIVFKGKVDAVVNNCHFISANSVFRKESLSSENVDDITNNHESFFDVGTINALTDNVIFNNCMFDSALGGEKLGISSTDPTMVIYKSDIEFNDCRFIFSHYNIDGNRNFYFKGYNAYKSNYVFNRCIMIDYVKTNDTTLLTHNDGYFFHGDYPTNGNGFKTRINKCTILTNVAGNKNAIITQYNNNPLDIVYDEYTTIEVVVEDTSA